MKSMAVRGLMQVSTLFQELDGAKMDDKVAARVSRREFITLSVRKYGLLCAH
jgi:hypothetical protein